MINVVSCHFPVYIRVVSPVLQAYKKEREETHRVRGKRKRRRGKNRNKKKLKEKEERREGKIRKGKKKWTIETGTDREIEHR